jgi:hypothetical protein
VQTQRGKRRLDNNRVALYVWPVLDIRTLRGPELVRRIVPLTIGAGLEEITILANVKDDETSEPRRVAIRFAYTPGAGVAANVTDPPTEPLRPLDEYAQKVQLQTRGYTPPATHSIWRLQFVESTSAIGRMYPWTGHYGRNTTGLSSPRSRRTPAPKV